MKLKFTCLFLLLGVVFFASAGKTLKLPNSEILQDRFSDNGALIYFNEKTKIIDKLANRELTTEAIAIIIGCALYDFQLYLKGNSHPAIFYRMLINQLIESLLQDDAEAIQELTDLEIYQPFAEK